jgi:hypothetical protein
VNNKTYLHLVELSDYHGFSLQVRRIRYLHPAGKVHKRYHRTPEIYHAHNRRWLAQYLSRQGKEDDAMVMDLAADQADARLLITQGALIARSTSPGTA